MLQSYASTPCSICQHVLLALFQQVSDVHSVNRFVVLWLCNPCICVQHITQHHTYMSLHVCSSILPGVLPPAWYWHHLLQLCVALGPVTGLPAAEARTLCAQCNSMCRMHSGWCHFDRLAGTDRCLICGEHALSLVACSNCCSGMGAIAAVSLCSVGAGHEDGMVFPLLLVIWQAGSTIQVQRISHWLLAYLCHTATLLGALLQMNRGWCYRD
jgi:hypothetical protein